MVDTVVNALFRVQVVKAYSEFQVCHCAEAGDIVVRFPRKACISQGDIGVAHAFESPLIYH